MRRCRCCSPPGEESSQPCECDGGAPVSVLPRGAYADAEGDAQLRSFMNWDELASNSARDGYRIADVRAHWAKLGQFRRAHLSVGAGTHAKLADAPYTFSRTFSGNGASDKVVVALDAPVGKPVEIKVGGIFANGSKVRDAYAGTTYTVANGAVRTGGKFSTVLLEPLR